MFSFLFLVMLISGFYRQVNCGYIFFVVMLCLVFWLKLTVHLLVDYPFGEPVGFFDGTPAAWGKVLLAATVGGELRWLRGCYAALAVTIQPF